MESAIALPDPILKVFKEEFCRIILDYKVPEWGLKDIADITKTAHKYGLDLKEKVEIQLII